MNRLTALVAILSLAMLASCKKEYSVENGYDPNNPPLGANCRLNRITQADSATGVGLGSFSTSFDANFLATRVSIFDSIQNAVQFSANLTHSGDTIHVDTNEYFLLGSNKRALSFHTHQDPADSTSPSLDFVYNYDGSGYMTKKEVFVHGVPTPAVRFTYTWANGNLVGVEGNVVFPGQEQKLFSATMEYDLTHAAKNFINIFPDGYEHASYVMAVDLGSRNRNVLSKLTASNYDSSGNVSDSVVTTFSDYKFSSDGYLLQWIASGDVPATGVLPPGLTKFGYACK